MFLILLIILSVGSFLSIVQRIKLNDKIKVFYLGLTLFISALFILPFFDPLRMHGYLAAFIMDFSIPTTIFAVIITFYVINCAIYAGHILASSINLQRLDMYRGKLIDIDYFAKCRHPISGSCHIIGLAYFISMGSVSGVIIFSFSMIFLNLEVERIEKSVLIPKFGQKYLRYMENVPKKMYSRDHLILLVTFYALFTIGLVGVLFFSQF